MILVELSVSYLVAMYKDYLSIVQQRGGEGAPTADDSSTLRNNIQTMVDAMFGGVMMTLLQEEDLINVMIHFIP